MMVISVFCSFEMHIEEKMEINLADEFRFDEKFQSIDQTTLLRISECSQPNQEKNRVRAHKQHTEEKKNQPKAISGENPAKRAKGKSNIAPTPYRKKEI